MTILKEHKSQSKIVYEFMPYEADVDSLAPSNDAIASLTKRLDDDLDNDYVIESRDDRGFHVSKRKKSSFFIRR